MEDTEPRVQPFFQGSYLETGMGPQGLAGAGLSVYCLASGLAATKSSMNKIISWKILMPIGIVGLLIAAAYNNKGLIADISHIVTGITFGLSFANFLRESKKPKETSNKSGFGINYWYVAIAVAISLCLILGAWQLKSAHNAKWACLQRIHYRVTSGQSYYRLDGSEISVFKTRDDALEYCLTEVSN